MVWAADTAFLEGLDFFSHAVGLVPAQGWDRPSPCAGWTARDIVGHVGLGTDFGTRLLQGQQPQWRPVDPPGEAVSGDPARWWSELVGPAREAVSGADLAAEVDSPTGRRSVGAGLSFPAVDLFLHGWDLARAAGSDIEIPEQAQEFVHSVIDLIPDEQVRSGRVFGREVAIESGTPTQRFVAWAGRDPR